MRTIGISLLVISLTGLTSCANAAAPHLNPNQTTLIDKTCAKVMGLRQGEMHFDECVDSLSASLDHKLEAERVAQMGDECRRSGLTDGTQKFSTCVLDKENASPSPAHDSENSDASAPLVSASSQVGEPDIDFSGKSKSYWKMSPTEAWSREKYSCAQLGLDPSTSSFNQCVADLDANLTYEPLR